MLEEDESQRETTARSAKLDETSTTSTSTSTASTSTKRKSKRAKKSETMIPALEGVGRREQLIDVRDSVVIIVGVGVEFVRQRNRIA
jgi:uncharacterized protein YdaT